MKKFLSVYFNHHLADIWLLLLRVGVGIVMLTHGYPKLKMLFEGGEISFIDPIGIGMTFSLILVVFAEFLCSIFVMLGLFTRLTVIPLIITMLIAVFIHHAADPFSVQEKGVLYLFIYVTILFFGSGRYSIDRLLFCSNCCEQSEEEE